MSHGIRLLLAAGVLAGAVNVPAAEVTVTGATATPWIIRQDGQLLAETTLALKNAGPPVKLWVQVAVPGQAARTEALGEVAAGLSTRAVRHAELAQDGAPVGFAVFDNEKCAGQAVARAEPHLPKARHWTIYVNHDMHLDVGYTVYQEDLKLKVWPGYLDKTFECLAGSADWPAQARARQELESSMLLYDAALLARDADWIETLKRHIREGRIGYSATFGNLAQENMSAEELVRSSYFSRRHLHDLLGGGAAPVANMADNNSLCRSAIDALAGAGVKYYTLRLWGGESRWRAPAPLYYVEAAASGKRLLVCDYGDYTKEPFNLRSGKLDVVRQAVERRLMDLQRSPAYPYDAVLCQFTNGDNGPPNAQVYQSVKNFNALGYEYPRMVCALPEDFYRHIEEGFAGKIPVLRGNFENWWNWGAGSTAYETAVHKQTQDTLAAAEGLAAFACLCDARRVYPCEDLCTAWKNMVLYAEHTWGANGSAVDRQWFWKRNTALQPEVAAGRILRASLAALNAHVPTDGPALVVWNLTPWKRTDVVRLEAGLVPPGAGLSDAETGAAAIVQPAGDGGLAFVAADVPAVGYRTFRISVPGGTPGPTGAAEGLVASAHALENRFFRVTFDAAGNISSILDKLRGGRELVDANCPHRLNQFIYWHESKTPYTIEKATLSSQAGPLMAAMTAEGGCFGVDRMTRTVVLYRDLPRIDFMAGLIKSPSGFGGKGKGWPKEEGYFVFPLNVPGFLLRHELPSGNVRPLVDPNPGEPEQLANSCTDHFTVNRWVDASNQKDFGVTLACVDAPLVMYGERRARTFDVKYKTRTPWVYSYVFNNLWYTNFQKTQPGRVVFRYSLRPHDGGDWLSGGAPRFGVEAHSPLRAARIEGKQAGAAGFAATGGCLLPVEPPNVMWIAAKLAEANGEGVILRFNEFEGRETKVTVDLARFHPQAVAVTDLVENDLAPVTLAGNRASFTVPGYGFATLRVTFGEPPAAPADLKATAGASGTHVTWDAPAGGAAHYEVFRGADAGFTPGAGTYLASVSSTHFLDRQVTPQVKGRYHYRVRAVSAGRKGAFSQTAAATPGAIQDTTPPTAPVVFAKALRFDKITLSWEASGDNVAVKGYKLFRDGKALTDLPAVYCSWIDLQTEPEKEYNYTIQAYDDAANLSEPGTARVRTPASPGESGHTPPAAGAKKN